MTPSLVLARGRAGRWLATGLLVVAVGVSSPVCAGDDAITVQTEKGPFSIPRGEIPLMYKDGIVNAAYLAFLGRLFPSGLPVEPVATDRQHFLYRWCVALYERKEFGQALACLDALRASVARHGDPEPQAVRMFSWSAPIGSLQQQAGAEFPLAVREPLLRSELLLELGDIAGAARSADQAMQRRAALDFDKLPPPLRQMGAGPPPRTACEISAATGPWACGPRGGGMLPDAMTSLMRGKAEGWSHLAVVYWLNGEPAKSDQAVAALRADFGSLDATFNKAIATALRSGLVRAYMARRDYAHALELADADSYALLDVANIGIALLTLASGSGAGGEFLRLALQDQHSIASRFQVAHARVEVGRFADAKPYLEEILGRAEIKAMPGLYWAALHDRGRVAEHEGQAAEAIEHYRRAVDEIERQRSTINTENAKIGFFGDKQAVYQALVRLLFDAGRSEEAFLTGERSKSRALVDMLANHRDFRIAAADESGVRQLLAQAQAGEAAVARDAKAEADVAARVSRALPPPGAEGKPPSDAEIGAALDAVRNLKVEARDALAAQAPALASLVAVPRVELAEIQRALPAGEMLVSYYYDAANLYAFVIDADGLRAIRLRREGLEDDVQALRRAIADRSEAWQSSARALHERLIAPLPGLKGSRLLIAGHGVLHYLPFGVLADDRGLLVDRYRLSFLPSASTLKFVGGIRADGKPGTLLAFGNPDLGDRRYDLAYAEREARDVSALFGKSALFVGRDASKRKLREVGSGFRYLHFATHGRFDAADPLGSALMLATDSVERIEDRLTIGELYTMRLDADLVTLSACETGLGKVASGDDVVGLVRGFLYAGANRIVSTLWEIDDEATAALMTDFYRRIKAGQAAVEALREAQLAARQRFPHPFYWAAFQVTGGR